MTACTNSSPTSTNGNNGNSSNGGNSGNTTTVSFATVKNVIDAKCTVCHSLTPSVQGVPAPAGGISFESSATIASRASQIKREVSGGEMPPRGSGITLTEEEKTLISSWVDQGASTN